jgi:hypothetical protein
LVRFGNPSAVSLNQLAVFSGLIAVRGLPSRRAPLSKWLPKMTDAGTVRRQTAIKTWGQTADVVWETVVTDIEYDRCSRQHIKARTQMIKRRMNRGAALWVGLLILSGSGGLMGPSDGEVMEADEASISHFPDVTNVEVAHTYTNGVDLVMANRDGSAYHTASYVVNGGLNRFYGHCLFTDYEDIATG